ncbi:TRAP transporter large permease [Adlercreutzia sp. ZJ304]|uniref:TRAP transporter large permease n=1 Tax=Adlercreutzia sp. ZJ304 TaxID=2709791 RepID=UPI0013E9A71C|nr:TRAP transporter large permease [Adlercreutzia sp. ZJ304]
MFEIMVGIAGILIFLALLITSLPVAFSMLLVGVVGVIVLRSPVAAIHMINTSFISSFAAYTTTVIPMFILMGAIAGYSGISSGLINAISTCIGHLRGGVAMGVQAICAAFGAVCGSIPATLATVGKIAYPDMEKLGYDQKLSTGALCAGSTLAVLIPPSITCITYSMVTTESVSSLFLSIIMAGIVMTIIYMVCIKIWATVKPEAAPRSKRYSGKERWNAIRNGNFVEILVIFVISMGGLFTGLFTATEAGAVGVIGVIIVTFITKKITWKKLVESMIETLNLSITIYFLLACASVFGKFVSISGIPYALAQWVTMSAFPAGVILLLITLTFLVLGMVIDGTAMILLLVPIFYPIITGPLGLNGLWFGVYVVVVLGLAMMSPPIAINTYIMQNISGVPLQKIFVGVVPFIICNLLMCVLLILFPDFFLLVPNLMGI